MRRNRKFDEADQPLVRAQAEAERARRAKVINAEGEFQASAKLRQAAKIMTPFPMAMQMRHLQTLAELAADKNSTIIFPLPLEVLAPFLKHGGDRLSFAVPSNGKVENASLGAKDQSQAEKPTAFGATPAVVGGNGR